MPGLLVLIYLIHLMLNGPEPLVQRTPPDAPLKPIWPGERVDCGHMRDATIFFNQPGPASDAWICPEET